MSTPVLTSPRWEMVPAEKGTQEKLECIVASGPTYAEVTARTDLQRRRKKKVRCWRFRHDFDPATTRL